MNSFREECKNELTWTSLSSSFQIEQNQVSSCVRNNVSRQANILEDRRSMQELTFSAVHKMAGTSFLERCA